MVLILLYQQSLVISTLVLACSLQTNTARQSEMLGTDRSSHVTGSHVTGSQKNVAFAQAVETVPETTENTYKDATSQRSGELAVRAVFQTILFA